MLNLKDGCLVGMATLTQIHTHTNIHIHTHIQPEKVNIPKTIPASLSPVLWQVRQGWLCTKHKHTSYKSSFHFTLSCIPRWIICGNRGGLFHSILKEHLYSSRECFPTNVVNTAVQKSMTNAVFEHSHNCPSPFSVVLEALWHVGQTQGKDWKFVLKRRFSSKFGLHMAKYSNVKKNNNKKHKTKQKLQKARQSNLDRIQICFHTRACYTHVSYMKAAGKLQRIFWLKRWC